MASIKLVYIGGGSSRAPGTVASFLKKGAQFAGSEIVLVDLDPDRLDVVRQIAQRIIDHDQLDIRVRATTDRLAGLDSADAVLTSFRPGGFAARALDERIPLKYGVIGQETQGPGGFFMALRSIAEFERIIADLHAVAPRARIFNYTNPVNIVSQAVTRFTETPIWSMCEGLIYFPELVLRAAGLDPARANVVMAGVNHNGWSHTHSYDGQDLLPLLDDAWDARRDDPTLGELDRRLLRLAVTMRSVPAEYYQYYFYTDDILRHYQLSRLTRAEFIMSQLPGYWRHYREQAVQAAPVLDPDRSRGGINELELALDVMDAFYNNTGARLPVNLPNNGALPGFDDDVVTEVWCAVDAAGAHPEPQLPLPHTVRGITQALAEYQYVAAEAAWRGHRRDAVAALAANPLVPSLTVAEAMYGEMAAAHHDYLPERLLR
ncbi:MAG: glycoside hydrolase [Propionibacteriaceae bacterium]|jgi:6-phospho-beta-glucosidase|nr:glycoside hydrolase [Propionibacteriaceae bacterium]